MGISEAGGEHSVCDYLGKVSSLCILKEREKKKTLNKVDVSSLLKWWITSSKRLELSSVFSLFLLLLSFLLSLRCVSIGLPLSLKTVLSIHPSFPPSVSAAVLSVPYFFVSPHLPPCSCPTNKVLPTFFLKRILQMSYKMNKKFNHSCNI